MVVCCKCNQTGQCKQCACLKAKKQCLDCLLSHLGNCLNAPSTTVQSVSNSPVTNMEPVHPDQQRPDSPLQQQSEGEWHEPSPTTVDTPNHSSDPFPIAVHQPFTWGSCSGPDFTLILNTTYTEVIHWRCNCFSVPFGKV